MANAQITNVGFISRHLFAKPNSFNGWISHEEIMTMLHPIVTVPTAACSHMTGNWAKPLPEVLMTIFEKNGSLTTKIEIKFNTTAAVDRSPCLTKFAFFLFVLRGKPLPVV